MDKVIILACTVGLAAGILLVIIFSINEGNAPSQSNAIECTGYLCKHQQLTDWNQMTEKADCRTSNCAVNAMLDCKGVTSIALFGNGENATIIRVAQSQPQSANGTMCWIDIVKPDLSNYQHSCLRCEYNIYSELIQCMTTTDEIAGWHTRGLSELLTKLMYSEPGDLCRGPDKGALPISQYFVDEIY